MAEGGGGGLAPFDQHGADLGLLEESAAELVRLSNQAIDQNATTLAAFSPAVHGWDGIAAPELRSAPDGVQQDAFETSSALAWGSVPLRVWAAEVTAFNQEAADCAANCAADLAALTMPDDPAASPNVALAVDSARATTRMHWERMWQEAYERHIVDGAHEVARMYREGPTEENLRAAGAVGIPYAAGGALAVLPALWHDANMRQEADDAIALAQRILADGDPSRRDLERLDALLREHGNDPAFAYYLMTGLGPDGLLSLTADVALMPVTEDGTILDDPDRQLAGLAGSIQAGLGFALATATNPQAGPAGYTVDRQWREQLLAAGPEHVRIDGTVVSPFGFHVLGVLLRSPGADFSSDFLVQAGGAMIDFEMDRGYSGNIDVWAAPNTELGGIRLSWIGGHDENTPTGMDPISGLMYALDHDRDAARRFFTTESIVDGESYSRVGYLLAQRPEFLWELDLPDGHDMHRPAGATSLVSALSDATQGTIDDPVTRQIVHDMVVSVGEYGVEVTSLRAPLAELAVDKIEHLYLGMTPGPGEGYPTEREVAAFLQELGKDGSAHQTLVLGIGVHAGHQMDQDLAGYRTGDGLFADVPARHQGLYGPIQSSVLPSAEMLRALSGGEIAEIQSGQNHGFVENLAQAGRNALDLREKWGPAAGLLVDALGADDALANIFDNTEELQEREAQVHAETRDTLAAMFWAASERNGGLGQQEAFDQLAAAEAYLRDHPGDPDATARATEARDYITAANDVAQLYVTGRHD